jgi:hypothetical protein
LLGVVEHEREKFLVGDDEGARSRVVIFAAGVG